MTVKAKSYRYTGTANIGTGDRVLFVSAVQTVGGSAADALTLYADNTGTAANKRLVLGANSSIVFSQPLRFELLRAVFGTGATEAFIHFV